MCDSETYGIGFDTPAKNYSECSGQQSSHSRDDRTSTEGMKEPSFVKTKRKN